MLASLPVILRQKYSNFGMLVLECSAVDLSWMRCQNDVDLLHSGSKSASVDLSCAGT